MEGKLHIDRGHSSASSPEPFPVSVLLSRVNDDCFGEPVLRAHSILIPENCRKPRPPSKIDAP